MWKGFEPSQPWPNEQSLVIVPVSMLKFESLVAVSMIWLFGRELPFVLGLHCSLKK